MFGITFRKETEEERWLRKALDGDNTATEWIYRRHVRYLSALCSRYITEDEDIKDVLQESFIKIFTFLDSFKYRGAGSLKAWMAKITLNETQKICRNVRMRARKQTIIIKTAITAALWLTTLTQGITPLRPHRHVGL